MTAVGRSGRLEDGPDRGRPPLAVEARRSHHLEPHRRDRRGGRSRHQRPAVRNAAEVHRLVDADEAEAPVPEVVEHVERLGEGRGAVAVMPPVGEPLVADPAQRHEGEAAPGQEAHPRVVLGGAGEHQPVGAAGVDDVLDRRELGLSLGHHREEEVDVVLGEAAGRARRRARRGRRPRGRARGSAAPARRSRCARAPARGRPGSARSPTGAPPPPPAAGSPRRSARCRPAPATRSRPRRRARRRDPSASSPRQAPGPPRARTSKHTPKRNGGRRCRRPPRSASHRGALSAYSRWPKSCSSIMNMLMKSR